MKKSLLKIVFVFLTLVFVNQAQCFNEKYDNYVSQHAEKIIAYRFEVLVYSKQVRVIAITKTDEIVERIIPAVTAQKDSLVPFNVFVAIKEIIINPVWAKTPEMLSKTNPKGRKHFKGGEIGNPLGKIAFYLEFKNPKYQYIRIHEAVELPQRKKDIIIDENGNLQAYRESNGCVRLDIADIVEYTSAISGLSEKKIAIFISLGKTKRLEMKIPANVIFLKE